MQCLVVLAALVAVACCKPQYVEWFKMEPSKSKHQDSIVRLSYKSDDEWELFKKTHKKTYTPSEESFRFGIFQQNVDYIEEHNKRYARGEKSYYLGINQFADMTTDEFRMYNGFVKRPNVTRTEQCSSFLFSPYEGNFKLPDSVDWRDKGYVTPVKNQGQCGSCWSFSTTGSVEGQHYAKYRRLVSLSEQQLVDCSGKFGNQGCNGGLMDNAFEYIKNAGGIESESEYPYDAEQERCHSKRSEYVANVTGCMDVESGSEKELKKATANVGPISVAIDASHQSFQLYKSGVYDEPECSSSQLDHGVLVVGYGSDEGNDYWIVKNSWGTVWGEKGFVKMSRNKDNQCGIATQASFPLV